MKTQNCILILLMATFCVFAGNAQELQKPCKVILKSIEGSYTGECKNGLANGKGESVGAYSYKGMFKNGLPNGLGTLYYSDSTYHAGAFMDGLKEGKGEMHFSMKGKADSVIKGYWSANEFRGKDYITYKFKSNYRFELTEFTPSKQSGHTLNIDIATTSGSPNGVPTNFKGESGNVLTLVDLISPSGGLKKASSQIASSFKSSYSFEISSFPVKLLGSLSNGEFFELELYKASDWKVRLFSNQ